MKKVFLSFGAVLVSFLLWPTFSPPRSYAQDLDQISESAILPSSGTAVSAMTNLATTARLIEYPINSRALFLGPWLLQAPGVQQIINATTAAHGGSALSQIQNSVATALLTDYRMTPSTPLVATFKSLGAATRLEYTDTQGAVALIRNSTLLWEVRSTQTRKYRRQHPAFQDVFFNASLGLVHTLVTPDFAYYNTATLRGRSVYVLRKSYWTEPSGSSNYKGRQEFIDVYIDMATYLIAQVDYTYGSEYNRWSFLFDNYTVISGVAVPATVSHWINNMTVWQVQVQAVSFNQSLNPQDFVRSY
jgi:hypothetical protein